VPDKPEADRLKAYLQGKVVEVDLSAFVIAVTALQAPAGRPLAGR
jgi:hypothetical protein